MDIIHCQDVGLSHASDAEHLEYATKAGRAVISQDRDFLRLDTVWKQQSRTHAGIMMVAGQLQGEAQISYLVRELTEYNQLVVVGAAHVEDDIVNAITWL